MCMGGGINQRGPGNTLQFFSQVPFLSRLRFFWYSIEAYIGANMQWGIWLIFLMYQTCALFMSPQSWNCSAGTDGKCAPPHFSLRVAKTGLCPTIPHLLMFISLAYSAFTMMRPWFNCHLCPSPQHLSSSYAVDHYCHQPARQNRLKYNYLSIINALLVFVGYWYFVFLHPCN